jgi:23S rRNA pseudouridine2604 synthase
MERINKYLSAIGICSRREADRMVEAGRIKVNGEIASLGTKVCDTDEIVIDGKLITKQKTNTKDILLAFNKPVGIVCTTTDNQGTNTVVNYINYKERIYPIGRLDKDSCGLILMTNNGEITDKILRSANLHEKEYIVKVNKSIDDEFLKKMRSGIYLEELDRTTNKCEVTKIDDKTFRIILTQGLNRQIRRMCKACNRNVVSLKRVRILNILLGDLKTGEYREIKGAEKEALYKILNS